MNTLVRSLARNQYEDTQIVIVLSTGYCPTLILIKKRNSVGQNSKIKYMVPHPLQLVKIDTKEFVFGALNPKTNDSYTKPKASNLNY